MTHLGSDLCEYQGKHYLIMVDRYSGYLMARYIRNQKSSTVINAMNHYFHLFGFPSVMRTDGGPNYRNEFDEFCAEHNIKHELSSAYNPESNGLAEAAVKNAKKLIKTCQETKRKFDDVLLEFNLTPRGDGYSPAEMFFGRRPKGILPTLIQLPRTQKQAKLARKQRLATLEKKTKAALHRTKYKSLQIGDDVALYDQVTKQWNPGYKIHKARNNGRSYEVIGPNERIYLRNRKFVKKKNKQVKFQPVQAC